MDRADHSLTHHHYSLMFVRQLSPAKFQLDQVLGWSSTTSTYAGSEFFINVFLFFLIFAGIILDKMGVRFTAILRLSDGDRTGIKVYALSESFNAGAFPYQLLKGGSPTFRLSSPCLCWLCHLRYGYRDGVGVTVSRCYRQVV